MAGYALSVLVCTFIPMPEGILSWILSALICVIASIAFVILTSLVLLPKEFKAAFDYVSTHILRRRPNA